jgi:hypothetical protein
MIHFMPRAATTSDTFNAIAEPRRRDILDYLAARERSVGEIVIALKLPQPSVYRTNPEAIRPLHEWASQFQRYWQGQLGRIKQRAERD